MMPLFDIIKVLTYVTDSKFFRNGFVGKEKSPGTLCLGFVVAGIGLPAVIRFGGALQ